VCTVPLTPGVNPIAVNKHIISYISHNLTRFNAFTTVTYDPTKLVLRNKLSAPLPPVGKSTAVNIHHITSYHISNLTHLEISSVKSDMPL